VHACDLEEPLRGWPLEPCEVPCRCQGAEHRDDPLRGEHPRAGGQLAIGLPETHEDIGEDPARAKDLDGPAEDAEDEVAVKTGAHPGEEGRSRRLEVPLHLGYTEGGEAIGCPGEWIDRDPDRRLNRFNRETTLQTYSSSSAMVPLIPLVREMASTRSLTLSTNLSISSGLFRLPCREGTWQ